MATMTYRCPVDPAACGESAGPGFCQTHRGIRLERVRAPIAATSTGESVPTTSPTAARKRLAVRILDRVLPVPPDGLLLGRAAPSTRYLPGFADLRHVGKAHARLYWHGDALYLADLGSQNGTFVDARPITSPVALAPGQVFNLAGDADVAVLELDENGLEPRTAHG